MEQPKIKDESSKTILSTEYTYDKDYHQCYANGALGGATLKGDIVVDFFSEKMAIPYRVEQEINSDGSFGNITNVEPKDINTLVMRSIQSRVYMNLDTAKSLAKWLTDQVSSYENKFKEDNSSELPRIDHDIV